MLTPDALTFMFVLVTSSWEATVPGLALAECNAMVRLSPAVVAEQQRLGGGYPIQLESARCVRERD